MVTAPRQSATGRLARRARGIRAPRSTEFVAFEDIGGAALSMVVAGHGTTVAHSPGFASRRSGPSDELGVERWLDEPGSFSREAMAR